MENIQNSELSPSEYFTLINCNENCIHCSDGHCTLGKASPVTNCLGNGCIYKCPPKENQPKNYYLQ